MNHPEIERRKAYTEGKARALRGQLVEAEGLLGDDGCVYATGSFGRLEAGEHSDLDLFIVGLNEQRQNPETKKLEATRESRVSNLSAICIKADLQARFRDPDQAKALGKQASEFGDAMACLLKRVGDGSRFYRLLIV